MENIGRNPVPLDAVAKRREYAAELSRSGLSNATVLKKVNELARQNQWGEISLRQLQRDISDFYRQQGYGDQSIDQARYLRENRFAQLDAIVEMMRLHIAQKDQDGSWVKGERAHSLKILFGMMARMAELNGWDFGKTASAIMMGVQPVAPDLRSPMEAASDWLLENPDARKGISEAMDDAIRRVCKNGGTEGLLKLLPENKEKDTAE